MEWEDVRHSFRLDRVWSSRLLSPMYPFFMHAMNDMLNMWKKKLNHTNLLMNESSVGKIHVCITYKTYAVEN